MSLLQIVSSYWPWQLGLADGLRGTFLVRLANHVDYLGPAILIRRSKDESSLSVIPVHLSDFPLGCIQAIVILLAKLFIYDFRVVELGYGLIITFTFPGQIVSDRHSMPTNDSGNSKLLRFSRNTL